MSKNNSRSRGFFPVSCGPNFRHRASTFANRIHPVPRQCPKWHPGHTAPSGKSEKFLAFNYNPFPNSGPAAFDQASKSCHDTSANLVNISMWEVVQGGHGKEGEYIQCRCPNSSWIFWVLIDPRLLCGQLQGRSWWFDCLPRSVVGPGKDLDSSSHWTGRLKWSTYFPIC